MKGMSEEEIKAVKKEVYLHNYVTSIKVMQGGKRAYAYGGAGLGAMILLVGCAVWQKNRL
jgi:hypothetical protein